MASGVGLTVPCNRIRARPGKIQAAALAFARLGRARRSVFRLRADLITFTGLTVQPAAVEHPPLRQRGHLPGALTIRQAPARAQSRLAIPTLAAIVMIAIRLSACHSQ